MKEVFIVYAMISILIIFLCVSKVILLKKKLYYKFVDNAKKITNYDYLMDYDGSWLYKEINYDKLYEENKDQLILIVKHKIKIYSIVYISLFLVLIFISVLFKFLGEL